MDVILRSRVGEVTISVNHGPKKVEYAFTEANGFTCAVPTVIKYVDTWGKEHIEHGNYAQHVLDNIKDVRPKSPTLGEPMFEIVEVVTPPVVTPPEAKKSKKEKTQ